MKWDCFKFNRNLDIFTSFYFLGYLTLIAGFAVRTLITCVLHVYPTQLM